MLRNKSNKQLNKCAKNESHIAPNKISGFWGWRLLVHLWCPKQFLRNQKWAPSAPKVVPMIEKEPKHDTEELFDCEKELQQSSLFGAWPGGLREALTIISIAKMAPQNSKTQNAIFP